MSSKLIIKHGTPRKCSYIPQQYTIKKDSLHQIKPSTIEQLRDTIKARARFYHSSSLTSMSTTFFSKKPITFPLTPKQVLHPFHKYSPPKVKLKETNLQIQKQMRKVKMKIRKMILNYQKQKPCEHFEKMNFELIGKIQDSFTCDKRIKDINKYNSKFHFGNVNYNYINEPLKKLIDVSEFNKNNMSVHDVFGNLTPQEKAIVALEPSYFVDGQVLLMKKVKAKSLSQKLNEEEEEEIKEQKYNNNNNNNNNIHTHTKYQQKSTSTYSDISNKYFEFQNQNEGFVVPLEYSMINSGRYLDKIKSKMLKELNEKMKEYECTHNKKDNKLYSNDCLSFAKTMKHEYSSIYHPLLFGQGSLNDNNNNNKRNVISGNDLRLRNTKEFLLKSNSERLIHERKRREKQYELEMKKSMNSNMKNYLDNIRKNISYKRQNS